MGVALSGNVASLGRKRQKGRETLRKSRIIGEEATKGKGNALQLSHHSRRKRQKGREVLTNCRIIEEEATKGKRNAPQLSHHQGGSDKREEKRSRNVASSRRKRQKGRETLRKCRIIKEEATKGKGSALQLSHHRGGSDKREGKRSAIVASSRRKRQKGRGTLYNCRIIKEEATKGKRNALQLSHHQGGSDKREEKPSRNVASNHRRRTLKNCRIKSSRRKRHNERKMPAPPMSSIPEVEDAKAKIKNKNVSQKTRYSKTRRLV
ncbi:hypothetical protein [Evansella tamaricis]|uniref:Uncharacterized protein n=1 Tax=Evansella tamaricis TaxID=2069301 RepID=A0ABS6JNI8_9BACI|nr:hypothetical protein [Evansella tamaricis]MBU9713975.1 hypothetical protein [Evansella tamaricis]